MLVDSTGVIHIGRDQKHEFLQGSLGGGHGARTLADAVKDADVFYGLSAADLLTADMVRPWPSRR